MRYLPIAEHGLIGDLQALQPLHERKGIWETRGGRKDYTYSRLMSWVAVERAIRIAGGWRR